MQLEDISQGANLNIYKTALTQPLEKVAFDWHIMSLHSKRLAESSKYDSPSIRIELLDDSKVIIN